MHTYFTQSYLGVSGEFAIEVSALLVEEGLPKIAQLYRKGLPPTFITMEEAHEIMMTEPWEVGLEISIPFDELPVQVQLMLRQHFMGAHLAAGGTEDDEVAQFHRRVMS